MKANNMDPDQTLEQSGLGPYCCNIGYLRTVYKQTRGADDKSFDWQAKGYLLDKKMTTILFLN